MNDKQFDAKWKQHEDQMFVYAFKCTKNRQDAEDIMSQAQLKAYRNRDKFDSTPAPHLWLRNIIKRLAIDLARRKSVRVTTAPIAIIVEEEEYEPKLIDSSQMALLDQVEDSEAMADRASIERIRARLSEAIAGECA